MKLSDLNPFATSPAKPDEKSADKPTEKSSSKPKKQKKTSSDSLKNHDIYHTDISSNRIVTRSQTAFVRAKNTPSDLDLYADVSRHQPPGQPHLLETMKGKYGAIPRTIITRSTAKFIPVSEDLVKKMDVYKKYKPTEEEKKEAEEEQLKKEIKDESLMEEKKGESLTEEKKDESLTEEKKEQLTKEEREVESPKNEEKNEPLQEDLLKDEGKEELTKEEMKVESSRNEKEDEPLQEDLLKNEKVDVPSKNEESLKREKEEDSLKEEGMNESSKVEKKEESSMEEKPTKKSSAKSTKEKPSSGSWKNHDIYHTGVSSNRIVTRSQTAFVRAKNSPSDLDLYADVSRHQPPGQPHLLETMKGKYGAIPRTIITRSTAKFLRDSDDLPKKMDPYKKYQPPKDEKQ